MIYHVVNKVSAIPKRYLVELRMKNIHYMPQIMRELRKHS